MKYEKYILVTLFTIISISCSLNYSGEPKNFKKKPNFIFKNTYLDRYENNSLSLKINSGVLEVYDADKIWAGEAVAFSKLKNGSTGLKLEFKGGAGIIKIDEKNERYYLGKDVFFEDLTDKVVISGDAFFWDKNADLLYGNADGKVRLEKTDEFSIEGSGFIANTLSRRFEFVKSINGSITTEKKTEEKEEKNE